MEVEKILIDLAMDNDLGTYDIEKIKEAKLALIEWIRGHKTIEELLNDLRREVK